MAEISLLFPNQLFNDSPVTSKDRVVAFIEDELFFHQFRFHKKKIILHRASMKAYEHELHKKGIRTKYFSAVEFHTLESVVKALFDDGFREFHFVSPDDYLLSRRLRRFSRKYAIALKEYSSPAFICTPEYINEFFDKRKRYFLTDFYVEQRKRLQIMIDDDQPVGGKWTYDVDNRKKMPASVIVPPLPEFEPSKFVLEAKNYVKENFAAGYGDPDDFLYPTTRAEAFRGLAVFLESRFMNYGVYQDAIIDHNSFLFHSMLTPALNVGLITPAEILEETLEFARRNDIPINSLEGFVRQILGWREFIRALYMREGVRLRKANHWEHARKLPEAFWNASTGVVPVDNVIRKVMKTAYSNHIERLMVMGNFMLLCEIHPDHVYHWFSELYIDAYDWVMVPNVYGMSQFSNGAMMSTKPYISGSNYVLKMSNYKKGPWCDVWDALYWNFINTHRDEFVKNPRMSMMVKLHDNMDKKKKGDLAKTRDNFLETLF